MTLTYLLGGITFFALSAFLAVRLSKLGDRP